MPGVGRDVAVAVVVTTMFGLGVLLALSPDSPPGIESLLFGDILGPTDADLARGGRRSPSSSPRRSRCCTGGCSATGFDRAAARSLGLAPAAADAALLRPALARRSSSPSRGSATCSSSPSSSARRPTARQLTDRIVPMIAIAVAIAVLAGLAGLYLSYYAGTAGGASVALAIVAAYLLALPAARLRRSLRGERSAAATGATIG